MLLANVHSNKCTRATTSEAVHVVSDQPKDPVAHARLFGIHAKRQWPKAYRTATVGTSTSATSYKIINEHT